MVDRVPNSDFDTPALPVSAIEPSPRQARDITKMRPLQALATSLGSIFLRHLNIGRKLTVGFGILVCLTLLVVALNYAGSLVAVVNINRTTDLRAPSALASAHAQADLLRMLGEVRGYLALGDGAYRDGYKKASDAFAADLAELDRLLGKNGTEPMAESVTSNLRDLTAALAEWNALPDQLFDLRDDQLRREPALKILIQDANPLIIGIVVGIKSIISTQQHSEASPTTMALLGDMAAFQSSFYAMVSGLRGYVTTRRDTFKFEYTSNLTINIAAWTNLVREENQMEPSQKAQMEKIKAQREAFFALPPKMFDAVEGEHAREDLFLFRTTAVPLAEKMLKVLDNIAASEQLLLQSDLGAGRDQLTTAEHAILVGGGIAVLLGLIFGFVFRENIAGPVRRLTGVAERVREGDLSARAQVEAEDEIGNLATTFNKMTIQLGDSLADLEERRKREAEAARRFRRQSEYLGALHDTALGLISRLDLTELLSDLTARASQLLGTPHGYVYLTDETHKALERRVGVGVYAASVGQKLQPNEGVAGRVWQSGEALVINDYDKWEGRAAAAANLDVTIRSCMGVPLKSGNDVVGVLGMAYDIQSHLQFGQEEVELLTRFAQLASISLDNARLYAFSQDAKRRAEEASQRVSEQNHTLESLSNKLSKYLSPQVYASIFAGKQSVGISSHRKKLTVFFSDIADFTGTTDNLESEELTGLLNHYLTEMSKIALDYGATIDKYIGDAILAFFGDPETKGVKEDAVACVRMAIAMQRRMRELQSEWMERGTEKPFKLRVGINTGFCTVGNFGSEDRMDYTIIGGEVNLAARLQSHAEIGGILIAHETFALVRDVIRTEGLDPISAKGFAQPVRAYRVLEIFDDAADKGRAIHHHKEGLRIDLDLDKLSKQDREEAIRAVEEVLDKLKH